MPPPSACDEQRQRGHARVAPPASPRKRGTSAPARSCAGRSQLPPVNCAGSTGRHVGRLPCRRTAARRASTARWVDLSARRPAPAATGTNWSLQPVAAVLPGRRRGRVCSLPSTGRPIGCPSNAASNRWSWTRSSGESTLRPAPAGSTFFSRSRCSSRNAGARTRSAISSATKLRSRASARPWNTVWSRAVQALRFPPTSSISFGERARVAPAGALEHHMLDQMREAAETPRLGARADARVKSDARPSPRLQRPTATRQAVRQDVQLAASLLGRSPSAACAPPAHR